MNNTLTVIGKLAKVELKKNYDHIEIWGFPHCALAQTEYLADH